MGHRIGSGAEYTDCRLTSSSYGAKAPKWRNPRKFDMDERELQMLVLQALEKIMADLTNLNAAVAANTQAVTDMQALITSLKAEIATQASTIATLQSGTTDQAGVDADTTQITTNTAALEALKTA